MRILVIAIVLATAAFELLLQLLTYSRRNAPLPENVKDIYDPEEYKKNQAYTMDKLKYTIITSTIIGTVISLSIFVFNVHAWVYGFVSNYNIYVANLFVFIVPIIATSIVMTIIGIYDTFVIEAKYGFNKTTPATYILDFVKNVLISVIMFSALLSLFIFLHEQFGNMVFLLFIFILIGLRVLLIFISPLLIRIFYKLTPLEDGELKIKIETLATKHNFKLKGIFKVDASKRSTKLNAFASGFGRTKTIGLFDTLLEKMTDDEIVGILAHEIGHAKFGHTIKSAPLSLLSIGAILVAMYFSITQPAVSQAFGFEYTNIAFCAFIMLTLASPIFTILQIPSNALSRKFEYQADKFAKGEVGKDVSITMMKKGAKENLSNLTPHPFVVMMEYSHPTCSQRVAAFEKD